jgi:hypothetical protein
MDPLDCTAMDDSAEDQVRRAARARWPVRGFRLGEEPGEDLSATTTADERLAMMWPLALEAWRLTGRPLPDYRRQAAPIRVCRLGEQQSE